MSRSAAPKTKMSQRKAVEPLASCQRMMWPLALFRRGLAALVPVVALRLVLLVSVR
ncbi:hypothetical protein D3C87_2175850 [compost metagenome]